MAGIQMSFKEAERVTLKNGFIYTGCNGDHFKYRRNGEVLVLNRKLNPIVWQRLVRQHRLVLK